MIRDFDGGADAPAPALESRGAARRSVVPRSARAPGMGFGHELLMALIMAVVMLAFLLLHAHHG
jgi:hypothetical protein